MITETVIILGIIIFTFLYIVYRFLAEICSDFVMNMTEPVYMNKNNFYKKPTILPESLVYGESPDGKYKCIIYTVLQNGYSDYFARISDGEKHTDISLENRTTKITYCFIGDRFIYSENLGRINKIVVVDLISGVISKNSFEKLASSNIIAMKPSKCGKYIAAVSLFSDTSLDLSILGFDNMGKVELKKFYMYTDVISINWDDNKLIVNLYGSYNRTNNLHNMNKNFKWGQDQKELLKMTCTIQMPDMQESFKLEEQEKLIPVGVCGCNPYES